MTGTAIRKQEFNRGVCVETIEFTDYTVPVVDVAGVTAKATLQLDTLDSVKTLPEGFLFFFGASTNLTVTKDAAGVDADAAGDIGLGTAQANNGATPLATTEQNLIPNTATLMSSGAFTSTAASSGSEAGTMLDNTDASMNVWLNFLIDDADQDATGTPTNLILNGTVSWAYLRIGDN